ncbi:hypothetical protein ACLBWT_18425 [Paenibacillus sp. D51F]
MSILLNEVGGAPRVNNQEQLEYKTIWCRLENGGFWLWRSRPAHTADRIVSEYNELVQPGRRYYAFPQGFDPIILGTHDFSLVVVQSIEDHLLHPGDDVYRRMKEQVLEIAILCHGMTRAEVETIEREFAEVFSRSKGAGFIGTGD